MGAGSAGSGTGRPDGEGPVATRRERNLTSTDREDRIRERAYKLWEEKGRPEGRDVELWEQAEDLLAMEENPSQFCAGK
jgi:hypothetical protein